jgi:L-2-hydroxyglutarate oxidase LhgO
METCDYLIIGGGIVGTTIARELKRRDKTSRIILLEKENSFGAHASGRNSGVIHAGFYYSADSLKARFTREGNLRLTSFCEEHKIPLNRCGKLVIAQTEKEIPQLDELLRRAETNGVPLENISEDEARKIEPRIKTCGRALFSPTTKTTDPILVLQKMVELAKSSGVQFKTNSKYLMRKGTEVRTSSGIVSPGYVINAAGLYADSVALDFGCSEKYRIAPFKGLYLYSDEPPNAYRTNIYPVPDLRNPFLGVHFTLMADGRAKIGPTAIPALWREQYKGFENFRLEEFIEIMIRDLGLIWFSKFDFKRLAFEEALKYSRSKMVQLAGKLATNVHLNNFTHWGKAGIRAQLIDVKQKKLEMDFVIEGDEKSAHILNAVSPAWTCSLPFADHVCNLIENFRS